MYFTEAERQKAVEQEITAFVMVPDQQRLWEELPEHRVVTIIKLWAKSAGLLEDVTLWVDVSSVYRYRVIPTWRREIWLRDHGNIYELSLQD